MKMTANLRVLQFGKKCPACELTKPVSEYYSSRKSTGNGYSSYCKACTSVRRAMRDKAIAEDVERSAKRTAYAFNATLVSRYGITANDAKEMLRKQLGLCSNRGCGTRLTFDVKRGDPSRAQVDHCHKTGNVRGILCRRCNTGASIIEKNENVYLGLLEYLSVERP